MRTPPPPAAVQRPRAQRGTATVSILIVLIGLQLAVMLSVLGGARDQDLGAQRLGTVRAFYAAEGAMNMALRELMNGADEDGDGTVGSISDDGNAANDPALSLARGYATRADAGGQITITSKGRFGLVHRDVQAVVTP